MKINIVGVEALKQSASRVRDIPAALARAEYRAVNAVASTTMTAARRGIAAEINLPASYIGQQMSLRKARQSKPEAEIRVRVRHVRLARFAARQLTAPVKHMYRSVGDPSRGIPWGRKSAGVSVKVKRAGSREAMRGAFLLPLRAGNADGGNGMGIFIRVGRAKGAIEHKYGPSPDQLFRRWASTNTGDIQTKLAAAINSQLKYELTGSRR
ncbi:phage tail protein [Thauera sp.]|uniref:phage tail protein n=1 Tax=Thauera sp. TaxID=1905334 RepID=UPI0039E5234C